MKIRLYRGPADGKVMEGNFGYHILVDGPKKMTREQQYQYRERMMNSAGFNTTNGGLLRMWPDRPLIRAEYQRTQFRHPDGSIFYEWTGYSKPYGPQ